MIVNSNGLNAVHLLGRLQSPSLGDKHFWAVLHQSGSGGGYFPIIAFPPRNAELDDFRTEVGALREGDLVQVTGRLSSRKECDAQGEAVLHPVTRRPFSRIEVVVYSIHVISQSPREAAQPTPARRMQARSAVPPAPRMAAEPIGASTGNFPPPPFAIG